MNLFFEIYNLLFYQPIYQTLLFFYRYLRDFGLSVIFLTILIRILLFPLDYKSSKEKEKFLKIQKEIKEIEKRFNGEKKINEILNLYKREKINPFFNLFSLFIQFPVLITLYQVVLKTTDQFKPYFYGVLNLSQPNFLLVLTVILLQFFYFNLTSFRNKKENPISLIQKPINFLAILFAFLVLIKIPSAISLYLLTNLFFLIFQKVLFHV